MPTFPAVAAFSLPPPVAAGAEDEEGGGDDEGEAILEPEKALRNENDLDEILVDYPCKLKRLNKDNEWVEVCKGSFRITRDNKTNKSRILVRDVIGKISLNAAFFKEMKVEKLKKGLRFPAFVEEQPDLKKTDTVVKMHMYFLILKDTDIDVALEKLQAGVTSCK
jgi:hypothetical protein